MPHRYEFGRRLISVQAANGTGTAKTIPKGQYLVTVSGEAVDIVVGGTTNTGIGTPLVVGTQVHIRVDEEESWAFFSSAGNGIIKFTRIE